MKIALALAALAALIASAQATCYCKYLSTWSGDYCNPATATPANLVTGYTYTKDTVISSGGQIGTCDLYGSSLSEPSITDLANKCTVTLAGSGCKAFAISYTNTGKLQVCYYSTKTTAPYSLPDKRCMGTWVKNDPPVVTPGCDCSKYGVGSGAYYKCEDCKRTIVPSSDAGKCCSCPANTASDPTNCIDCVVTANPADRSHCAECKDYYADGTNGLIRCWECVKLANNANAYGMTPSLQTSIAPSNKKWEMCHNFCRMLPTPRFPGMNDPSQCEDCVKDNEAQWFVQVAGNPNGQCPTPGRRLAAL